MEGIVTALWSLARSLWVVQSLGISLGTLVSSAEASLLLRVDEKQTAQHSCLQRMF